MRIEQQETGTLSTKVYSVTGYKHGALGSTILYREPFLTDEQWLLKIKEDIDEVYRVCAEELL